MQVTEIKENTEIHRLSRQFNRDDRQLGNQRLEFNVPSLSTKVFDESVDMHLVLPTLRDYNAIKGQLSICGGKYTFKLAGLNPSRRNVEDEAGPDEPEEGILKIHSMHTLLSLLCISLPLCLTTCIVGCIAIVFIYFSYQL